MVVFLTPLITDIMKQSWESIRDPYDDLVVLLGDDELRETVKGQQFNDKGLDSDGWSCVDYVKHFDREGIMGAFMGRLRQSETKAVQRPNYMKPAAFAMTKYRECFILHPCIAHSSAVLDRCNQVHGKLRYDFTRMIIATNTLKKSRS